MFWVGLARGGAANIREALYSVVFSCIQLFVGEYLHTLSMRTAPSLASSIWDTIAYVGDAYRYPGMVQ